MPNNALDDAGSHITVKDWLVLIIFAAFTAAGLLILRTDVDLGVTTLALFGSGLAFTVHTILRKRRFQRLQTAQARVVGSTPIRPPRHRLPMMGLGLAALGSVLLVFGHFKDAYMTALMIFLIVLGVSIFIAAALGLLPAPYMQFEPVGFTIGGARWKATLPWESIGKIQQSAFHNNPVILLWLANVNELIVEPAPYRVKVLRQIDSSRKWLGADFMIMPASYSVDAPILFAALERYLSEPETRGELKPQAQIRHFQ